MASQIMDKIAETEALCDAMREEAKREAAAILDEAEKKTAQMRSEARDFARDQEKRALEDAKRQIEKKKAVNDAEIEEARLRLRGECEGKRAAAVRQTALYLLELAKGG